MDGFLVAMRPCDDDADVVVTPPDIRSDEKRAARAAFEERYRNYNTAMIRRRHTLAKSAPKRFVVVHDQLRTETLYSDVFSRRCA